MSIKFNGKTIAGYYKTQIIPSADTVNEGTIKIATQEAIDNGTDNKSAVTPYYLQRFKNNMVSSIKYEDNKLQLKDSSNSVISETSLVIEPDNTTIVKTENNLQVIGNLTMDGTYKKEWIGTLTEYNQAKLDGIITDETLCLITDDYETSSITDVDYYTKAEIDEKLGNIESLLSEI